MIKGPIELTVQICHLVLKHPFYFYDGNLKFLMTCCIMMGIKLYQFARQYLLISANIMLLFS